MEVKTEWQESNGSVTISGNANSRYDAVRLGLEVTLATLKGIVRGEKLKNDSDASWVRRKLWTTSGVLKTVGAIVLATFAYAALAVTLLTAGVLVIGGLKVKRKNDAS